MDEKAVAQGFFERLEVGDVEGAMALTTPDGEFQAVALGVKGTIGGEGQELLEELRRALPDVTLQVTRLFAGHDGTSVAEVFVDGTQADDLFGIVNQEKHVDVSDTAVAHVVEKGFSPTYGARFLKRTIDELVKLPITNMWKEGDRFQVDFTDDELKINRN